MRKPPHLLLCANHTHRAPEREREKESILCVFKLFARQKRRHIQNFFLLVRWERGDGEIVFCPHFSGWCGVLAILWRRKSVKAGVVKILGATGQRVCASKRVYCALEVGGDEGCRPFPKRFEIKTPHTYTHTT